MKTMYNLSELAAILQTNESAKADYVIDATAIHMLPSSSVMLGGEGGQGRILPATALGHRQIADYAGIPGAYYDKMRAAAPQLLADSVNRWMEDHKGERRMVRSLDGNMRALLSDRYQRIDNVEVAEVALNVLQEQPGLRVVSTAVTESRLYIKAVSSSVELKVPGSRRVGDFVQAGVLVSNSETGQGSVSIKPFAEFLICTNGMVRDSVMRAAHVGRRIDASIEGLLSEATRRLEDEVVLRKVRDVIRHAFDAVAFQAFIDKVSATTQDQITGDVHAAVERLGPTLGLVQSERVSVLRHLAEGGDLSRYGLVNAVTRSAQDVESYDRATELETAGFRLIELPTRDWAPIAAGAPLKLATA